MMSYTTSARSANEQFANTVESVDDRLSATNLLVEGFTEYARERPEIVALWAFGIGFVLGWKLKSGARHARRIPQSNQKPSTASCGFKSFPPGWLSQPGRTRRERMGATVAGQVVQRRASLRNPRI